MSKKILVVRKKDAHPRTAALAQELVAIIPNAEEWTAEKFLNYSVDAETAHNTATTQDAEDVVTIQFTEDTGPQFVAFKSATHQLVFKIIEFKSRADMGISDTIKRGNTQLVLSKFTTSLGMTIAEFLMDIFPVNLDSNQVVNFTVHKDFLFIRMYRFCIREKGPAMEKIGPHLTLRLWRMTEYVGEEKRTHDFKKYVKNLNLL